MGKSLFYQRSRSGLVFFSLVLCSLLLFCVWSCAPKKTITVSKLKYNLGFNFSSDTIDLIASRHDVVWQVLSDKDWVLLDSQGISRFGSSKLVFSVLENSDTTGRSARVIIFGQDVDTVFIDVIQGRSSVSESLLDSKRRDIHDSKKKPVVHEKKDKDRAEYSGVPKIKVEKAVGETTESKPSSVETKTAGSSAISSSETEGGAVSSKQEKDVSSKFAGKKDKEKDKEKDKMELSVDQVVLGAAGSIESAPISLQATGKWSIKVPDSAWIKVLSKDGAPLLDGAGGATFKIVTLSPNTSTVARDINIEFKMGQLISNIKVTQKATEASLTVDKSSVNFDGEPGEDPVVVKISAVNTQWSIDTEIPSWLSVNKVKGGTGESSIELKAALNEGSEPRSVKLSLTSTGGVISREINVVQDIRTVTISVTEPKDYIGSKAESFTTFTVTSSAEWEVNKKENTWYDLDLMNGTGGEDNVETVTITANQDNTEYDRSDTFFIVAKTARRRVIVTQKGMKLKEISMNISPDTLVWNSQISNDLNFKLYINVNDSWVVSKIPDFLSVIDSKTGEPVVGGSQSENLELKLLKPKDSIKLTRNEVVRFESKANPNIFKLLIIKVPVVGPRKEINVTGLNKGEFMPYLELGNITKSASKTEPNPRSKSLNVFSSVEFSISSTAYGKSGSDEAIFYDVVIDKEKYVMGDLIGPGNHEVTFDVRSDNVSVDIHKSRISLIHFMVDGEELLFNDNSNGGAGIKQFELKQEPLILDEDKVKVFIYGLKFNGYNSQVILGNPKNSGLVNPRDTSANRVKSHIQRIRMTTSAPVKLVQGEDKKVFFEIRYGSTPDKVKNDLRLGKTVLPKGDYYFEIEAKANYTDASGFQTNNTMAVFIEKVAEEEKGKKNKQEDADGEQQDNKVIFIDYENKDFAGLYFRDVLLIEQESL